MDDFPLQTLMSRRGSLREEQGNTNQRKSDAKNDSAKSTTLDTCELVQAIDPFVRSVVCRPVSSLFLRFSLPDRLPRKVRAAYFNR